jgi:hypothetical protein
MLSRTLSLLSFALLRRPRTSEASQGNIPIQDNCVAGGGGCAGFAVHKHHAHLIGEPSVEGACLRACDPLSESCASVHGVIEPHIPHVPNIHRSSAFAPSNRITVHQHVAPTEIPPAIEPEILDFCWINPEPPIRQHQRAPFLQDTSRRPW